MTMSVPRYTSYPTIPHFGEGVTARTYAGWLEALDVDRPVSLYLHVPFYRQICWYCGCNMKLANRYEPVGDYVEMLLREVDLLAGYLPGRMKISHLHWGGGSPMALEPDDLARLMEQVFTHFDPVSNAELAIECDLRTLSAEMAARIGSLGFNRASFGIQEFDPQVQKAINRIQSRDVVAWAVDSLRCAGVEGINFDLTYGLPYQTSETLARTISQYAKIGPDRVALFGYAHVPWMARKQRLIPEEALPGARGRFEQSQVTARCLRGAGYEPVGLDHFARPHDGLAKASARGELRRNFQRYTNELAETLLGVGATSIGRTPSGLIQNISETGAWARSVASGQLPVSKGHAFSGEDRLRAHVIEQLMCFGRVDLVAAASMFGAAPDWFCDAGPELQGLADDGIVSFDERSVIVQPAARHVVRVVASAFDAYFVHRTARHSLAV